MHVFHIVTFMGLLKLKELGNELNIIYLFLGNASSIVTIMSGTSPNNGLLLTKDITVTPYQLYNVDVEVMLADIDHSTEYANISINGNFVGKCNPNHGQGSCNWHTCDINPRQAFSTNSVLPVKLQYSVGVNNFATCTFGGQTGHAVARVFLTSTGYINLYFLSIV